VNLKCEGSVKVSTTTGEYVFLLKLYANGNSHAGNVGGGLEGGRVGKNRHYRQSGFYPIKPKSKIDSAPSSNLLSRLKTVWTVLSRAGKAL